MVRYACILFVCTDASSVRRIQDDHSFASVPTATNATVVSHVQLAVHAVSQLSIPRFCAVDKTTHLEFISCTVQVAAHTQFPELQTNSNVFVATF